MMSGADGICIYVSCIEIKPLEGCQLDPREYIGAAVRCYIPARNEGEANEVLLRALKDDRMELVEIEFLVEIDSVEWENPENDIAIQLSNEAKESGYLIYGEFRAWDQDDECEEA